MSDLMFNFQHAKRISALVLNQALQDYRRGTLHASWFSGQVATAYLTTMGLDPELISEMAYSGELKKRTKAPKKKHIRSEFQESAYYLEKSYRVLAKRRKR